MTIMMPVKNVFAHPIIALQKVMETLQTKEHEYTVKVSKSSTTVKPSKSSTTVKLSKFSTTHIPLIQTKC